MQMTYIGILAFCLLKYYLDNVYKLSLFHPETEATIQQLSFFFCCMFVQCIIFIREPFLVTTTYMRPSLVLQKQSMSKINWKADVYGK